MFRASENMEDRPENGAAAIDEAGVQAGDVVGIACNSDTRVLQVADIAIFTDTGPEVLAGSIRLKAGTAQKIVLNTLTTAAMTKSGKVYENMMINLKPSNIKLRGRVIRIVSQITGYDENAAIDLLEQSNWAIQDDLRLWKERN